MNKRSNTRLSDSIFRHQWIAQAAYYKAESRHFTSGKELDDWVFAEKEFIKMQIRRYQIIANEDGGFTVKGLQRLATSVGVESPETMIQATELIHAIQKISDNESCFSFESEIHCNATEPCLWKAECKKNKMIARW